MSGLLIKIYLSKIILNLHRLLFILYDISISLYNICILYMNKQIIGSRAQVMHGNALKTSGGLTKDQLKYNKQGKIVSKKASALAKNNNRLVKAGYITIKGQFGVNMTGGDNKFELGTSSKQKYKHPSKAEREKFLRLHITPLPEEIVKNKNLFGLDESDYMECSEHRCKYEYKVNHNGVVKIFLKMWKIYLPGLNPPSKYKLEDISTRHIIMYLGKKLIFKYVMGIILHKEEIFGNIKKYTNLANKNKFNNIKGLKITPENFKEQTLWKLAIYHIKTQTNP